MKFLKISGKILLVLILTTLSQTGGLIYLLSLLTYRYIDSKISRISLRRIAKLTAFVIFYLITTFIIVPLIAPFFGRVRLPLTESNHLKPLTFMTCLLNRNYVKPELKDAILDVADKLHKTYPGTTVNYLDANFPFIYKFPLLPHLSHNDGKKLDLAFCYTDRKTNAPTNDCPSPIGYGICEEPRNGQENTAAFCSEKGYWQYDLLKKLVPQGNKEKFLFDSERTAALVELCGSNAAIGKIFIEPHLKARLKLTSSKIRFHGCQAVRHDDHIHIQMY